MAKRVLSALVGLPLLLLVVWAGFPWFTILVAVVSLLALRELARLARGEGLELPAPLAGTWAVAFIVNGQTAHRWGNFSWAILSAGAVVAFVLMSYFQRPVERARAWTYTVFAALYVGLLPAYALLIRQEPEPFGGWRWVFLALLVTFATDTGAFFVGKTIGRHKLAPLISPGKTWEGAVGGLVCAIGAAFLLNQFLLEVPMTLWKTGVLGALAGALAQLGDLLESWLKRRAGVKDASSLIPGHGGVLDRLDSIVFNLPLVYYWTTLVERP